MHARKDWPDEHAFLLDDERRRRSDEVDLGATWRAAGSSDTWRLAWLRDTGEVYVCRNDSVVGGGTCVQVLAVVADEREVDALLEGWQAAREDEDGLAWLRERVAEPVPA